MHLLQILALALPIGQAAAAPYGTPSESESDGDAAAMDSFAAPSGCRNQLVRKEW